MGQSPKFYRTEITFVILSEREIHDEELSTLVLECNAGDFVGKETKRDCDEISASRMRDDLMEAGSDPGFFSLDLGTTTSTRIDWIEGLGNGDRVQWNDPDEGKCSGRGTVTSIQSQLGCVENTETIICLRMDHGGEAEVTCKEIDPVQSEREDFLMDLWCDDQVKYDGEIYQIVEAVLRIGDPETWVWNIAKLGANGDLIAPVIEVTGNELS